MKNLKLKEFSKTATPELLAYGLEVLAAISMLDAVKFNELARAKSINQVCEVLNIDPAAYAAELEKNGLITDDGQPTRLGKDTGICTLPSLSPGVADFLKGNDLGGRALGSYGTPQTYTATGSLNGKNI